MRARALVNAASPWAINDGETGYILDTIARYFERPVTCDDVVWSFSGIRPLYDDKAANASAVTRDYVLDLDAADGAAPMLSVFGGKITTYRKLAEHTLRDMVPLLPGARPAWMAGRRCRAATHRTPTSTGSSSH